MKLPSDAILTFRNLDTASPYATPISGGSGRKIATAIHNNETSRQEFTLTWEQYQKEGPDLTNGFVPGSKFVLVGVELPDKSNDELLKTNFELETRVKELEAQLSGVTPPVTGNPITEPPTRTIEEALTKEENLMLDAVAETIGAEAEHDPAASALLGLEGKLVDPERSGEQLPEKAEDPIDVQAILGSRNSKMGGPIAGEGAHLSDPVEVESAPAVHAYTTEELEEVSSYRGMLSIGKKVIGEGAENYHSKKELAAAILAAQAQPAKAE